MIYIESIGIGILLYFTPVSYLHRYMGSGNLDISLFSSPIKRLKKHRKNGLILKTGLFIEENGVVSRYLPIYLYDNVSKKTPVIGPQATYTFEESEDLKRTIPPKIFSSTSENYQKF